MKNDSILKNIFTVAQRDEAINVIEDMIQKLYKKPNQESSPLSSSFSSNISESINNYFTSSNINDKIAQEKILRSLIDEFKSINVLKITLSTQPAESTFIKIKNWMLENMPGEYILDLIIDAKIIGGAIITTRKGEYENLSISKKIDDLFSKDSAKLRNLLFSP